MCAEVNYNDIISVERMRPSSVKREEKIDEFYSDRSRILYSSSFRRLQQKAQVFSLELNSNVRTRLVHSFEVSDIGRILANRIFHAPAMSQYLGTDSDKENLIPQLVAIVENACLLHDIGNPPFGHFAEEAIKKWATTQLPKIAQKVEGFQRDDDIHKLCRDFGQFDGNPQGFRTISYLTTSPDEPEEYNTVGLNLTFSTMLAGIKYPRSTEDTKIDSSGKQEKAGYFISEKKRVEETYQKMNWDIERKYPLAYIMEAADDIAYCLSDISDGIEKKIITMEDFIKGYNDAFKGNPPIPLNSKNTKLPFHAISVKLSNELGTAAVEYYCENHKDVWAGKCKDILSESKYGTILEGIRSVARKQLYRSFEAESMELSGNQIILGLLKHFGKLLNLKKEKFDILTDPNKTPQNKGMDLEWRIYNRLPEKLIRIYKNQLAEMLEKKMCGIDSENRIELWLRVHLILDHICGMTDDYALQMYQMFEGIIRK